MPSLEQEGVGRGFHREDDGLRREQDQQIEGEGAGKRDESAADHQVEPELRGQVDQQEHQGILPQPEAEEEEDDPLHNQGGDQGGQELDQSGQPAGGGPGDRVGLAVIDQIGIKSGAGEGLLCGLGALRRGDGDAEGLWQAVVGEAVGAVCIGSQVSEKRGPGAAGEGRIPALPLPDMKPGQQGLVVGLAMQVVIAAPRLLRDEQIQVVEPVRSVFHQNGELRLGPHIGGGADREQSQTEQQRAGKRTDAFHGGTPFLSR